MPHGISGCFRGISGYLRGVPGGPWILKVFRGSLGRFKGSRGLQEVLRDIKGVPGDLTEFQVVLGSLWDVS